MKAKNCLIFGGSGQIGANLIRKLTRNNVKVTVVTRNIHQKGLRIKTQANAGYIEIKEANIYDSEAHDQRRRFVSDLTEQFTKARDRGEIERRVRDIKRSQKGAKRRGARKVEKF